MGVYVKETFVIHPQGIHDINKVFRNIGDAGVTVKKHFKDRMKEARRRVKPRLRKGNGVVKDIIEYSPRRRGKRKPGSYKRSLIVNDVKVKGDNSQFMLQVGAKGSDYRLSHLLEHGHRVYHHKENGKKVFLDKNSKAIPHMIIGQDYIDKVANATLAEALDDVLRHAKR